MMGRIVLILAAVALLVAMLGKLRLPGTPEKKTVERARKCPGCDAWIVGEGGCTTPGCREA